MKINFPYLRKKTNVLNSLRIEVMSDSMRVGKTTAVKVIADGLRLRGRQVSESYEDWQHNPYLKKSYSDPAKNFLESQKWFIRRKHQQIVDGLGTPLRSTSFEGARQVFIQDVSPEMDYCYAETNRRLGRMSDEHFAEYDTYFRSLDWGVAPAPDLMVYLQVSDDELLKRAEASRREFETVEADYFLMMKKVNREWLSGISNHKPALPRGRFSNSQMNILVIDTDKLDFAHDESAKRELVEQVAKEIGL